MKNILEYQNLEIIAQNFSNIPFPDGWKANANGVDLNLQFPAEWNKAKLPEIDKIPAIFLLYK